MRLLLVRHGQTPSNVARLLDTALPGPDLTELGREQAEGLVAALDGERVDAVWASAARRAQATAAPLATARGVAVQVTDGLREVEAGELEMRDDDASVERYLGTVFAWAVGDLGRALEGAETGPQALARLDAAVAQLSTGQPRDACVVVVSHGAALRLWTAARATGPDGDSDAWVRWVAAHPLGNTGIIAVEGDTGSGWRAVSWAGAPVAAPAGTPGTDGPAAQAFGG